MKDHITMLLRSRATAAAAADVHPLRLVRAALDLSQAELEERAGLGSSTVSRIESRERLPDEATRAQLATALDIDVDLLFPAHVLTSRGPRPDLTKVDTTAIIDEELKSLGYPLPNAIARLTAGGLANAARLVLQERDQLTNYTESEYRSAVREAIQRVLDPNRNTSTASAQANLERNVLHEQTLDILDEQGKRDEHTPDEYMRAFRAAERKSGLHYTGADRYAAEEAQQASAPALDGESLLLHVQAELILGERGAKTNPRGELVYTAAEYADALLEARDRLNMLPPSE
jgi:transcriptional regulator with XRE-family HTH domain